MFVVNFCKLLGSLPSTRLDAEQDNQVFYILSLHS